MLRLYQDVRAWHQSRQAERPNLVGIYALPRGGSNFLSAWLHYHPNIFAVSERHLDWNRPLWRYWSRESIFRKHGVQDKRIENISHVIFNKVQRDAQRWGVDTPFPVGTKMVFYLRNPVKIFLSREDYRHKADPDRVDWAASEKGLSLLIDEFSEILEGYNKIRQATPSFLLGHEYFCCHHEPLLKQLYAFLGVPDIKTSPENFFRRWESDGALVCEQLDEHAIKWLVNSETRERLLGFGRFNPVRNIDLAEIRSDGWKQVPGIEWVMDTVRTRLGDRLADYYWNGSYDQNIDFEFT